MSENTFNPLEINLQTQPLPTYIDADGSFKLNTPMLSSFDFDGLIPKFDGNINAIDVKPGYMIQAVSGEYFPVISVEYDEDDMEDVPPGIVTINYLNDQGNIVSVDYDESDPVAVVYEDWNEKSLGTQGWGITAGGNAIFTNVAVRGRIEAEEGYISGNLTIGSGGSTTLDDVATADDLTDFITGPQLQDNTTIISGGNIQTGTISAITFQTNLSGRRSKLGAGNAYIPSNWNTTIIPRTGGGSTSYIPTGLEFYDQNGARTGYFYSLDKYTSGTFQSGSRLFVFGTTDSSGNDTGTEILISQNSIDLYASSQIDLLSDNGVRLYGSNDTSINVGSFGSDQVYIDGQKINFSQGWSPTYGPSPSAQFYSHIYAMSGYKFFGDGSGLTNIPAPANVVLTTGTYSNPSWITSLAGSKITGNIDGNSKNITQYTVNQNVGTGNNVSFNTITTANAGSSIKPSGFTNSQTTLQVRLSDSVIGYFTSLVEVKENIVPLIGDLPEFIPEEKIGGPSNHLSFNPDNIFNITPIEYIATEDESREKQVGFIVEDLLENWPQAVTYNGEDPVSYNTNSIVAGLVYAVKKQKKLIEDLEARVLQLESQLGG